MKKYKQFLGPRQRRRRELRKAKITIILMLILFLAAISSWTGPRPPAELEPEDLSALDLQLLICDSRWSGFVSENCAKKYPEYASLFREAYKTQEARNPLYGDPWELTTENIQWMVETATGHPALAAKYAERYPAYAALFLAAGGNDTERPISSCVGEIENNGI